MQSDVRKDTASVSKVNRPQLRTTSIDEEIRNRRVVLLFAVLFIVLSALPVLYFSTPVIPSETPIWRILPAAIIYLLLGTLFSTLLTNRLRSLYGAGSSWVVGYTVIVFVLVIAAISLGVYFKTGTAFTSILFYSSIVVLPYTILQTWLYYKTIATPPVFKIWFLPPPGTNTVSTTVFLNSIQVQIRLSAMAGEPENVFEAIIPGRLTVGEMFSFFLKDKQDTEGQAFPFGEIMNSNFGWQFFTTSLAGMGMRQLDPDESLIDNGIKNNATIIIRRVQTQLPEKTAGAEQN